MKRYRALQPVTLMTGSARVTDAQANRRQHCLQPLGDGEYLIIAACNFKAGEVFEVADMGKHPGVEEISAPVAAPAPKPAVKRPRKK